MVGLLSRCSPFASTLFFLSGATALVYEVLWFRRIAHVWGSSSLAMAAVMAAFLLGLGLGARFLGRRADRVRRPLVGYAACEAGIALWALLVPALLVALERLVAWIYPTLSEWPVAYSAVQIVLAFLVLGPACFLMGATLPLLVRQFTGPDEGLGGSTAWLYALNTVGAAFGCFAGGFLLLPQLGLVATGYLAVGLNLGIAFSAWVLGRRLEPITVEPVAATSIPEPELADRSVRTLYAAAAASGFAALALQMVWARQLAVMLGGSTYAFSAMLVVVLIGIGAGSLLVPVLLRKRDDAALWFGSAIAVLVVFLVLGQRSIPLLSDVVGDLFPQRTSYTFNALLCTFASAGVELLPSFCAGLTFPLVVHLTGEGRSHAGSAVGGVYFWNTIGTVAGVLTAQALLVPMIGTRRSVLVAAALYLLAAILLLWKRPVGTRLGFFGIAAVMMIGVVQLTPSFDPRVTERGLFAYGPSGRNTLRDAEILFHREGEVCNVLVTRVGKHNNLRVNGKVDASTYTLDQVTQLGSAYLPRFLRPDAKEVLVIGYGSGVTVGASLLLPGTQVVCVEIERGVVDASEHFDSINHSPENSPNLELRIEDGRGFLFGTPRTFDLIVTEPSNPWMAGVANLFTVEFYEGARDKLRQDGILAQWVQAYGLSPREHAMVIRTVHEVFPHVALVRFTRGDSLIVASQEPLLPDAEDVRRAEELVAGNPVIRDDLARFMGSADVRALLFKYLVLGREELEGLLESIPGDEIQTDSNLHLEFDAPRHLHKVEKIPGQEIDGLLIGAARIEWQRQLAASFEGSAAGLGGLHDLYEIAVELEATSFASDLVELGLELDPEHPAFLADSLIDSPPGDVSELGARLDRVLDRSTTDAWRVADAAWGRGDNEVALLLLDRILARKPDCVTARGLRASTLWRLERFEEAAEELARAVEADPLNEVVREAVRELRRKSGS